MHRVRRRAAASQNAEMARPAAGDTAAAAPSRRRRVAAVQSAYMIWTVLFLLLDRCAIGVGGFVPAATGGPRSPPSSSASTANPYLSFARRPRRASDLRHNNGALWAFSARRDGAAASASASAAFAFVGSGAEGSGALPSRLSGRSAADASVLPFGLASIPRNLMATRLWARLRPPSAADDDDDDDADEEDLDVNFAAAGEGDDDDDDEGVELFGPRSAGGAAAGEDDEDDLLLGADDNEDDDEEPADVPDDWTEQDILAELGDDLVMVEDDIGDDELAVDDDESIAVVVAAKGTRRRQSRSKEAPPTLTTLTTAVDDEDDVDVDLEELDAEIDIDIDEEDDDDDDDGVVDATDEDEAKVVLAWDEDEDDDDDDDLAYPVLLQEDVDDPNEVRHREIVAEAIAASERRAASREFDPVEFLQRGITDEQRRELDQLPFLQAVEERARALELTEGDLAGVDLEREMNEVTDLMSEDPYLPHSEDEVNVLEQDVGITDEDMQALDRTYKEIDRLSKLEPWDKVMVKDTLPGMWDSLPNQTMEEMSAALEELGGSSYNVSKWLLYDLDFNVTNLILAAVKHNPKAPVLLQHWYPQLVTYDRYQSARDRDFGFTWDDVESADLEELRRYYAGFGYDDIPKKAPAETGMIGFEDLDEEEIKMAAFENWMTSVYNPEWDRTDFDDDDMRDEDNVFSEFYDPPQHPDLPSLDDAEDDIDGWNAQLDDVEAEYAVKDDDDGVAEGDDDDDDAEAREYRNMMGQKFEYDVVRDPEFEREFRGHLIVACSGAERDLDVAEAITSRFEKEFGKQVYVETRVMALAREEDNVFEVWLESYEIDLLHSKKRATSNTQDWKGPADCDATQIDYLVDRVRFLISDEARYSYRMDLEHVDA